MTSSQPLRIALAAYAACAFASARAQESASGFALDRFQASEHGSEWFTLEGLDLRGHWRAAAGVLVDGAYRPLAIYAPGGALRTELVRHQALLHGGASLIIRPGVRVGIDLPLAALQNGDAGSLQGTSFQPPTSVSLGDVRAGMDVRLLGETGGAAMLGIGLQVFAPTGSREQYTGDGTFRLQPRILAAGDLGIATWSALVAFQLRPLGGSIGGVPMGSEVRFGAGLGLRGLERRFLAGLELYGSTVVSGGGTFQATSTPLEALLGLHYLLGPVRLGAGAGMGLTRGIGSPSVRWIASAQWAPAFAPPPADRDGDGVVDAKDACPDEPGQPRADLAVNGCPDRDADGVADGQDACPDVKGARSGDARTNGCPPDRDGDGVADAEDACPDAKGVRTSLLATNGCPPDRDGDGVPDAEDACPDKKGEKTDSPRTNGCPRDSDSDGIPDAEDACPAVPGIATRDRRNNGCPPDPDRDRDGIVNEIDACPDDPGKPHKDPKRNGCPVAFVRGKEIRILDQVKFKTNSAEILPTKDSLEVLKAVHKVLADNPRLKKIRVEGHTDNQGKADYNKLLSARRAASVVTWLVGRGIVKERLTSEGWGMEKPIGDNRTALGRKDNRRVEFHIVDQDVPMEEAQ